ncbi:MAG: T9SS type A sorting domain-containing protein [Parabacteroides sp.]
MRAFYTTLLFIAIGILPLFSQEYKITVIADPAACGTATANYETAAEGTRVTLQAYPKANCKFISWTCEGQTVSTSCPYRFDMPDHDVTYYAHFTYVPDNPKDPDGTLYYNLQAMAVPESGGRVNIASQRYKAGEYYYNTAYPHPGYTFDGWFINGELFSTDATKRFMMPEGDCIVEARFTYNPQDPGSPGANVWDPEKGVLDISDFAINKLASTINQVLSYEERDQVLSFILTGAMKPSNNYDYDVLNWFSNCTEIDLSRVTGMTELPIGQPLLANLHTFHLPSSITKIHGGTFSGCPNLNLIYCSQLTPPSMDIPPTNQPLANITVFVPREAIAAYQADTYWGQMNIQSSQEDWQTVLISLPEQADPKDFASMKLELINRKNGQTIRFVMTSRKEYQFTNILPHTQWSVIVKNEQNDILGDIELIEVNNAPVQATIDNLKKPINLSMTVKDPTGKDLTSQTQINWLDAQNNHITSGPKMSKVAQGKIVKCQIGLQEESLVTTYQMPETLSHTVTSEQPDLVYTLKPYEQATLKGQVVDAGTGIPLANVKVKATQNYEGRYTRTPHVMTDNQGRYTLAVAKVPTVLSYTANSYQQKDTVWDYTRDGSEFERGKTALSSIQYTNIGVTYAYTQTPTRDNESATTTNWMSDYRQITYSLYNETQRCAITDFKVEPANLVIAESVQPGDQIKITASSTQQSFQTVSQTVTIDEEGAAKVHIPIVEYGHLHACYGKSSTEPVVGVLYDSAGKLVTQQSYQDQALLMKHLPDGNYTLVTLQDHTLYSHVTELSQLTNSPLENGTDYAAQPIQITSGQLVVLNLQEVPALRKEQSTVDGISASFYANATNVVIGNYATMTAKIGLNTNLWQQLSGCELVLPLPEGIEMVENSVQIGNTFHSYTVENDQLVIPLFYSQEAVRFCLTPTEVGSYTLGALLRLHKENGETMEQPIGYTLLQSDGLSVDIPRVTTTSQLSLTGHTLPNAKVELYDNGEKIGENTALLNGIWTITGDLVDAHNLSRHEIQVKATTEDGNSYQSEKQECVYNGQSIAVSKVKMYSSIQAGRNTCQVFDFLHPSTQSDYYTYSPVFPQFTFTIEFTQNDPDKVKDVVLYVKTSKSGWHPLKATYDTTQQLWTTVGEFGTSGDADLPVNVSVDFTQENTVVPLDNDYLLQRYAWSNSFKEAEETLPEPEIDTRVFDAMSDEEYLSYLETHQEEPPVVEDTEQWGLDEQTYTLEDGRKVTTQRTTCEGLSEVDLQNDENYMTMTTTTGSNCYLKRTEGEVDFIDFRNNVRLRMTYEPDPQLAQLRAIDWNMVASFSATFVSVINAMDDHWQFITNFLKNRELAANTSYRMAESGYKMQTTQIEVLNKRIANAPNVFWQAKWKAHLKTAKLVQKAHQVTMSNNMRIIRCIKGILSVFGSGIDLAINARKGYQAVQDWSDIFRSIEEVDCPGMDRLLMQAWLLYLPINTFYTSACLADLATLATLRCTITAEMSLLFVNISIWGAFFGDLIDMNAQWAIRSQIPSLNCNDPKPLSNPDKLKNGGQHKSNTPDKKYAIDPSGYVYEGVFSNRVEGAKTTLYFKENSDNPDTESEPILWDASEYAQENPLYTDKEGFYRWDVPEGLWQVKYEKQGYETSYSDWLPVPPPQLDVNMGMLQLVEPSVLNVKAYEDAVEITFDKYMQPATLNWDNIKIRVGNQAVTGTLRLLNEEVSYEGNEDTYASKVRFDAEQPFEGTEVKVFVSYLVTSYADMNMAEDYLQSIPIEKEIKEIVCDDKVTMEHGTSKSLTIQINPKEAAAGRQLNVSSSAASIVQPQASAVTIDSNGKAQVTIKALLPGNAKLTFEVEDTDKRAEMLVNVTPVEEILLTAGPTASIPSETTVELGTEVTLDTETIGATIYYTIDGSCPCDPSSSVKIYDNTPIPLDHVGTFIIKALAKAPGRADSEIVEYSYTVVDPTENVTIASDKIILYPLPMRDRLHIQSPIPMQSITLLSMDGRVMLTQPSDRNEDYIEVSHIPDGTYILKIVTDKGTTSIRKVIKAN